MRVVTTRFGELDIPDEEILYFPQGLIGFESCTHYAIVGRREGKPVWWLQSLELPEAAFILTDPRDVEPTYRPEVPQSELEEIELTSLAEAELHVMLVVRREPKEITANLLGPLVINARKRLGKQVVLTHSGCSPTHRLTPPEAAHTGEGGGRQC
jgi:flagellar assembly factor FliW